MATEGNKQTFQAGEVIFRQGDTFNVAYTIEEGEVDIIIGDHHVCTLGKGEIFGEMAFISANTRSATASARTDVTVSTIDEKQFMFMVDNNRFFVQRMMQVLADRLRDAQVSGSDTEA